MTLPPLFLAADTVSVFSSTLMPILMVGAVFFFLVYLPNRKEEAARKELIASLQKGDRVVTDGLQHARVGAPVRVEGEAGIPSVPAAKKPN